jgi:hypothetical protein
MALWGGWRRVPKILQTLPGDLKLVVAEEVAVPYHMTGMTLGETDGCLLL